MALPDVDQQAVAAFIAKWCNTPGGAERANYVLFLSGLCRALGLAEPDHAQGGVLGAYQFEGPVAGGSAKGNKGFIDLYRKGSFVLEAKQSQIPVAQRDSLSCSIPPPPNPAHHPGLSMTGSCAMHCGRRAPIPSTSPPIIHGRRS